jgi:hypothetical protein
VHPENLPIGDGLFEFGIIYSKALAKAFSPMATPPHPHKIVRRGQYKKNRKKNVINGTHSSHPISLQAYTLEIHGRVQNNSLG